MWNIIRLMPDSQACAQEAEIPSSQLCNAMSASDKTTPAASGSQPPPIHHRLERQCKPHIYWLDEAMNMGQTALQNTP